MDNLPGMALVFYSGIFVVPFSSMFSTLMLSFITPLTALVHGDPRYFIVVFAFSSMCDSLLTFT